ncbi:MAG: hypothetical protein GY913_14735 [Proteobacteria bacterium]|nr:hypothetical protein [Pseudomonadota bacterium]MCP4918167.1 hypothetical protein [Pseudomonadota bacterium]
MWIMLLACTGVDAPDDSNDNGDDGLSSCLSVWSDGVTEPLADGPDTQIHGTSVFDGRHLWMAWNIPNEHSTFDVQLARYTCDGVMDLGPIDVTAREENDVDPALGVVGDEVVVAWTTSVSSGVHISAAGFVDGQESRFVDPLQPTADGVLFDTNSLGAVMSEGGWLAGSFSNAETTGFQAVRMPIGDWDAAVAPGFDAQVSQTEVDLVGAALVWQQDEVGDEASTIWQEGSMLGQGLRPVWIGKDVAWDDDAGRILLNGDVVRDDGFQHSPAGSGEALLSMRVDSGIYNDLVFGWLGQDPFELEASGAPSVYGVDVTQVDADHAVVVWQEGDNPDFRLRAQWISR